MTWLWIGLAAAALAAWAWLLVGRSGFWRAGELLAADDGAAVGPWPPVTAVMPARNEAEVIGAALRALAAQDYPGRLAVIVVDDGSTDDTAALAGAERPSEIVAGSPPPRGWTGKLWALDQGVARAAPETRYLWLTDADIVHPPDTLRRLVAKAETDRLDLVSLMVRLRCETAWEKLLIPAFVFFFRKLYPFPRVNDAASPTAAAAGGCMLLSRQALARIGGLAAIRGELIDDCALAREVKRGGRIWLGLADGSCSIRPYDRLADIWAMVARTAFHQLGYSTFLLAATVIGMLLLYAAPPLAVLAWPAHGGDAALALGALAWLAMAVCYRPTSALYGRKWWEAALLPLAAALYAAMTVDSVCRHWRGQGGMWKARAFAPEA
jgi:hopene-associated glycosyltransferase HpnB